MTTITSPPPAKRKSLAAALAVALALAFCLTPAAAQQSSSASLADRIAKLVTNDRDLTKATIGVHVRNAATGSPIYGHNAETPLIPASNLKLLTTGAAALVLGPDAIFATKLALDGDRLIVIGSGDPGFADPDLLRLSTPPLTVDDLLAKLAGAAADRASGPIREIVIDDRIFDRDATHPTWPDDQLNRWYCAEVSGLNFHTNCLHLIFEPSAVGASARIVPSPALRPGADWYTLSNRTKTVAKGRNTVWVARPTLENSFTAYGDVLKGAGASVDVAVHDPGLFFGTVLAERLATREAFAKASIPESIRLATDEEDFSSATVIAEVRTGMEDILRRSNKNSQNLYTEALVKRLGHEITGEPGSWANGPAVVRMLIAERLGPDHAAAVTIVDGSGMSRGNTIAPATLTAWMAHLATLDDVGPLFVESLPRQGEGTLRNRFRGLTIDNTVRAKSGTISGVRCLSGLVISGDDPENAIAFAVMVNEIPDGRAVRAAKRLHELIVDEIDNWLGAPAADAAPAYGG